MTKEQYEAQIVNAQHNLGKLKKKLNQVITLRVITFLFLVGLVTSSIYFKISFFLWITPFPIAGFLVLLKWNNTLKKLKDIQLKICEINQQEISVLEGDFSFFSGGAQFLEPHHDYAHDMDLFGEKSIFQYINRTSSMASEKKLASFFNQYETSSEEIKIRQEAIKELTPELEWRQLFLANAQLFKESNSSVEALKNWMHNGVDGFKNHAGWKILTWLTPVYAITVITLSSLGYYSGITAFILLLLPMGLIARELKLINYHHQQSSKYLEDLKKHKILTSFVENKPFNSKRLLELKDKFYQNQIKASKKIDELAKIVESIDNRSNALFAFFANATMLWDIKYTLQLKKWLNDNKLEVDKWFNAVNEMECYLSFSNFAFNQPNFIYPVLRSNIPLKAIEIGHPLISSANRINNTFHLSDMQQFSIITGANMAGKSTFLRSVGVNLILAMCGAPVCAKEFEFKPIRLFSSMRTADSLSDSESYFYAELKRLKSIVDELKAGNELFVILDEILKGTNSKDKAEGSKKIVRQLVQYKLVGIIATHDLSLCTLQDELPHHISNYYFDVEIVQDELHFDYTLKPGICSNMNAEFLMNKMGITT